MNKLLQNILNKLKLESLVPSGLKPTIGNKFKDICFVGLNRVEYLSHRENENYYGDNWQDLTDEQSRKNLTLAFFAPRQLDGSPVNPYVFLSGEDNPDDEDGAMLAEQSMADMPLLDMCRMAPAEPNTVNIIIAADIIFHWDISDNYILPTTQFSWQRDVQELLKTYPKSTTVNIYSDLVKDKPHELSHAHFHPLRELPLDEHTWLNMPTFQEKYGTALLVAACAFAALTFGLLELKQGTIRNLNQNIQMVQQQIPRESSFAGLSQAIAEQEKFMRYRPLFPLLIEDVATTITHSKMDYENFEIKNPQPLEPADNFIATIEAKRDAYEGWLEEEPVAKDILANSATISAIRKPPGNTFRLEGLIELPKLWKEYRKLQKNTAKKPAPQPPASPPAAEGETP